MQRFRKFIERDSGIKFPRPEEERIYPIREGQRAHVGATEIAQWVRALAAETDNLS